MPKSMKICYNMVKASCHERAELELLAIERELAGPTREAALARYDQVLVALGARLDAALGLGLPPDEYARAAELREANVIARKLLRLAVRDAEKTA